mgnify:CR=1 FL=1
MKKPLLLLLCLFTVIGYAKDPHIKAVYALIRASHTRIWETDQTAIDRPRQWRGCV